MDAVPLPTPIEAYAPDLARRVGMILAALVALVARRFLHDPFRAAFIVPLCRRLTHRAGRFQRLLARLAAGKLPPVRTSVPKSSFLRKQEPILTAPSAGPRPRRLLPCTRGWLIRALGSEAACYASQLEAVLAEPAAAELLALVPTAGRILHPIRWILGLAPLAPRVRSAPAQRASRRPRRSRHSPLVPTRPRADWPTLPWLLPKKPA